MILVETSPKTALMLFGTHYVSVTHHGKWTPIFDTLYPGNLLRVIGTAAIRCTDVTDREAKIFRRVDVAR